MSRRFAGSLTLAGLALPGFALAQSTPQPSPAPVSAQTPAGAPTPVTGGWQNGFVLQTTNGDNRLQLGVMVQLDGRFSVDAPSPVTDTFTLRKARPVLSGRIARHFDYRLMTEFGNGTAGVLDAYVDLRISPWFRVRTGKDKTPVSYEHSISDAALLFPERALPTSLLPNRDLGVEVLGDLAGGTVSYQVGVFNGVVDGASSTSDVDTNAGKDLAGRVIVQPFPSSGAPIPTLRGLGFSIGGTTGSQTGALPTFRTTAGNQTYFSYAPANGSTPAAVADGSRRRIAPAVFYYARSFGAFAEYVRATQVVTRGATTRAVTNQGWVVSGGLLLTGETASSGLPSPRNAFDPHAGTWGAFQIVARYAELAVDDEVFAAGFAASGASRKAQALTIGANWYPVQPVKYYLTYERTVFDDGAQGARPNEHVVLFRVQVTF